MWFVKYQATTSWNSLGGITKHIFGGNSQNEWGLSVGGISVGNENSPIFFIQNGSTGYSVYNSSITLSQNKWYHLTGVKNDSAILLYLDSILLNYTPTGSAYANCYNTRLLIGKGYDSGSGGVLNGSIDEVMIFNRSLNSSEISELYQRGFYGMNFSHNFTSLPEGTYHYNVTITDTANNKNTTTLRTQIIDSVKPNISLVTPTLENDSYTNSNSIYVNVSTNDSNEHSSFIDFNKSLVGWWRMDEINLTRGVYDNSSYGNHGVAYGNANQTASGKRGKAFSFDGGGDYVLVADNCNLEGFSQATWSVWIKPKIGRASCRERV